MKVQPMLAELASEPFDSETHIFEVKWDGVRCIAHVANGSATLVSRSGREITAQFPELNFRGLPDCILDGEIVCLDQQGRSVFNLIQRRIHNGDPVTIHWRSQNMPATYQVFDILYLEGESLMRRPLSERRRALATLKWRGNVRLCSYIMTHGVAAFQAAEKNGLEGIIAKDLRAAYSPGKRSPAWKKLKVALRGDFWVCGITEGEGWRSATFGALVLAERDEAGRLRYVGNVGTGFDEDALAQVMSRLCLSEHPPFDVLERIPKLASWARPEVRCRVKFLEKSNDGKLRFPVFEGIIS